MKARSKRARESQRTIRARAMRVAKARAKSVTHTGSGARSDRASERAAQARAGASGIKRDQVREANACECEKWKDREETARNSKKRPLASRRFESAPSCFPEI
eukprot:1633020-Pleurochrysis_carterae.AAC.1